MQLLTISLLAAAQLERRSDKSHQHAHLESNRTHKAATHPIQFVNAICKGIENQVNANRFDQNIIKIENGLNVLDAVKELQNSAAQCHEQDEEYTVDDVNGAALDPKMVKQARADEIAYIRTMKSFTKVLISECFEKTCKAPLAVRRIDVNKQDNTNPLYSSRRVGKELNTYNGVSLYAATPLIESLRALLHLAATNNEEGNYKVVTNDGIRLRAGAGGAVYLCQTTS